MLERNIPAYAGKTRAQPGRMAHTQEHPRVCGENSHTQTTALTSHGTSPRMRGKQGLIEQVQRALRNIPAYAGKTLSCRGRDQPQPEHPRVCGENPTYHYSSADGLGTSPRMRGKLFLTLLPIRNIRNIPAYAGKTHRDGTPMILEPEHPRVCGENLLTKRTKSCNNRNIPAYAGKTHRKYLSAGKHSEHPRVCGENTNGCQGTRRIQGTSPRMRGKLYFCLQIFVFFRNIPAYAGKTPCPFSCQSSHSEHPRVCGENRR